VQPAVNEGSPGSQNESFYIGDDEGAELINQAAAAVIRRKNFPLAFRPDPSDDSYVGMCARYEFECQDLFNEERAHQQAMEETRTELTERMWRLRDQCSDEIPTRSNLQQRLSDAQENIRSLNDSCMVARSMLEAELADERFHREQIEADFQSEEAEVKSQVEECHRQLKNMSDARDALRVHLISMRRVKDMMEGDIADERRMTEEIAEAGKKQMVEWTEQQQEIRTELNEALAAHRGQHDSWKARIDADLQYARAEKGEADAQEADLQQQLSKAQEEMSRQAQNLRTEVSERTHELQELGARIEKVNSETQMEEENKPQVERTVQSTLALVAERRKEQQKCQEEIAMLHQDCVTVRAHLEELRESEQVAAKSRSKPRDRPRSEDIRALEKKKKEFDDAIEDQKRLQEDLRLRLEMAVKPGLFSCFWPSKQKIPARVPQASHETGKKPGEEDTVMV
jgi:hypothetical protein